MSKTPTEQLRRQLVKWRKARKLSAQALADRITGLGGSLSRVAISRIENGERAVTLDEWLQLAHALAVPPPLLFLDLEDGELVKIADEVVLYPWLAWQWVVGDQPPVMSDRTVTRVEEWMQAQSAVRLYTWQQEAAGAVDDAKSMIRSAEFASSKAQLNEGRARLAEALRVLAGHLDAMVEIGMTPPPKPKDWIDTIRELSLSKYPDSLRASEPAEHSGMLRIVDPPEDRDGER